jgi:RNase H-fold protein (predicted Holliday junction resolvase)
MQTTHSSVLSLDVGAKRIGVAVANLNARIARPLTTLVNDDSFDASLASIIAQESVGVLVVGYPRGLQGGDIDALAATFILEDFLNEHTNLQEQHS